MVASTPFHLSDDLRKTCAATVILDLMLRKGVTYDVLLEDGDSDLSCTLEWLLMKQLVCINKEHRYTLTEAGKAKAQSFAARYQALLTYFDIFGYVDLEAGEFAFTSFPDFNNDAAWQRFLEDERWEDLRIPMIEHLGGSGVELVFAHFVREHRFDFDNDHWQLELKHGALWQEILDICYASIRPNQLGYDDGGTQVSGDSVLDDIAEQGFQLLRELHPSDPGIHSNLQAWYPSRTHINHNVPVPLPGWEKPIWQTPWSL